MRKLEIPTKKLTYEEFLKWCDEDTWAEWVDGEVIVLTPASDKHQNLADFLTAILRVYTEARGLGVVRSAPFQMKTEADLPGREPDLLFVAKERLDLLKGTYLDGPADLVVEITSPESRLRDRGEKFAEYELGGVREYWLLDPEGRRADFYKLGEDGRYRLSDPEASGVYRSKALPGSWLRVAWLWQEPPAGGAGCAARAGIDLSIDDEPNKPHEICGQAKGKTDARFKTCPRQQSEV